MRENCSGQYLQVRGFGKLSETQTECLKRFTKK